VEERSIGKCSFGFGVPLESDSTHLGAHRHLERVERESSLARVPVCMGDRGTRTQEGEQDQSLHTGDLEQGMCQASETELRGLSAGGVFKKFTGAQLSGVRAGG
jgi:hypothetical protein